VNQTQRDFPQLADLTRRFSTSTSGRLARALVHVLRTPGHSSATPLRNVIVDASHELRAGGMDDQAVLTFLGTLVEEAARACGANGRSVLSGEPRWMPIRTRVLSLANAALAEAA
jgi:hypothetical protein